MSEKKSNHPFLKIGGAAISSVLINSTATANISKMTNFDSNKLVRASLSLKMVESIEEQNPNFFAEWISSTERLLNRSLHVNVHEENDTIELFCFDCDARLVDSAVMQFAENDSSGDPPIRTGGTTRN